MKSVGKETPNARLSSSNVLEQILPVNSETSSVDNVSCYIICLSNLYPGHHMSLCCNNPAMLYGRDHNSKQLASCVKQRLRILP